jgi:hypothetical protein
MVDIGNHLTNIEGCRFRAANGIKIHKFKKEVEMFDKSFTILSFCTKGYEFFNNHPFPSSKIIPEQKVGDW